ncbi:MAG: hypothetical protein COZ75_13840 [Flavobacteriaceae bacterium CG_4_8_14_3_um_filter_34_10]|nr:fasciclin domain-containing protein [Flavobacteriia bacterium]OIP52507.1 MAG: hypothetical protein AUK33_00700 [Flavobacteriaceae bacterium CG2_30_34_30]PIV50684.1 MAG: hypothetical protein COS19_03580 [Flavobacteriaceae bacterium CG02_land_8_20_14_3_00_34_13]PIX08085.1 MAG: hypothetical protein COZ75_13840 [Flavobacteriaceae bacterium CG_4_8_14_3_um_filter_34_10]PJC08050.1 MAG: hypothetical protein CO068_02990 [Flavobacteriaceae bacterium CG_4_9_14_0_8_um_filter_34_30]
MIKWNFINKLFLSLLAFSMASLSFSQSKYLDSDAAVRTSVLEENTIYSNKTLMENLAPIENFSKFVKAFTTSALEKELSSYEMYTVFVPSNEAFSKYSKKELDSLFSDKNVLKNIFSFHVILGRVDKNAIEKTIEINHGSARYKTLNGQEITFRKEGDTLMIIGYNGSKSEIYPTNFYHKNGFFHIIDGVLLSK